MSDNLHPGNDTSTPREALETSVLPASSSQTDFDGKPPQERSGYRLVWLAMSFLLLIQVGAALIQEWRINGDLCGFPLDDSWIHMTLGRNQACGKGFSMNPGVPVAASTGPLWTFIVTAMHWVGGWGSLLRIVLLVKLAGFLLCLVALAGWLEFLALFQLPPRWAALASALLLFSYPFSWAALSGMEVPLVAAIVSWALYFQCSAGNHPTPFRRLTVAAFLWGISAWARPEMMSGGLLMLLATLLQRQTKKIDYRILFPWALALIPLFLFNYSLSGSPLPTTMGGTMTDKALIWRLGIGNPLEILQTLLQSPLESLAQAATFVFQQNPLLLLFLLAAPLSLHRSGNMGQPIWSPATATILWMAWALLPLQVIITGLVHGTLNFAVHHGRYLSPLITISGLTSLGVCLKYYLAPSSADPAAQPSHLSRMAWAIIVAGVLFIGYRQVALPTEYALEVQNIRNLQVRLAFWLKRCPPEMRIGINDIGAIGYFSPQFIIDLEGLATPAAIEYKIRADTVGFIEQQKPDILLIFPSWFPEIVLRRDLFTPRRGFALQHNYTGGGEEKVLFTMPWSSHLPANWPALEDLSGLSALPVPVPLSR